MNSESYKLLQQSDGVGFYAEVSVVVSPSEEESTVEMSEDVFAWLKDEYGKDAWEWPVCDDYREAALRGARHALANIGQQCKSSIRCEVSIIRAHPAHSTEDAVAYASCHATWKAIGVPGINQPYWDARVVRFPCGT